MSTRANDPNAKGSDHDHDAEHAEHGAHLPEVGESLPPIDFTTFVLSLASTVLVNLGEVPDPDGKRHDDLPIARQNIDLLLLLHTKTKGNLTGEEERLLDRVLLDLRMKFVEAAGRHAKR